MIFLIGQSDHFTYGVTARAGTVKAGTVKDGTIKGGTVKDGTMMDGSVHMPRMCRTSGPGGNKKNLR